MGAPRCPRDVFGSVPGHLARSFAAFLVRPLLRRLARSVVPLACLVALGPAARAQVRAQIRAQVHVATLGRDGWSFERFGDRSGGSVAVLRAAVAASAGRGAARGSLLISCVGDERRLRLILPDALPASAATPPGASEAAGAGTGAETSAVLIRSGVPGDGDAPFLVARATLAGGRILTLAERGAPERSAVLALVRLLDRRPERLDMFAGSGVDVAPFRSRPLVLVPSFRPSDALALAEFRAVCEVPP